METNQRVNNMTIEEKILNARKTLRELYNKQAKNLHDIYLEIDQHLEVLQNSNKEETDER